MSDRPEPAESAPLISVVVPLYNEEENIQELHRRLERTLRSLGVAVRDPLRRRRQPGSNVRSLMQALRADDRNLACIHLSRNFGHQAAVSAGIDHGRGQAVDRDGRRPPGSARDRSSIRQQMARRVRGRLRRPHGIAKKGSLKRAAYSAFYRILNAISDLDIPLDSGDFCLMDRRVVDVLKHLPERMRFVRGLRSFVGFRQVGLPYDRAARAAGRPEIHACAP